MRKANTKDRSTLPGKPPLPPVHRNRGTGYHIPSGGFPLGPEEQDEAVMLRAEASDLCSFFPCTAPSTATGSPSPPTGGKVIAGGPYHGTHTLQSMSLARGGLVRNTQPTLLTGSLLHPVSYAQLSPVLQTRNQK